MSAINKQFSIAIHLMTVLGFMEGKEITSTQLAMSINTSPSFVRRILSKLSKAGLVRTTTGKTGSCALSRSASKITLLNIYEAIGSPQIFSIHEYPIQEFCKVSCHIKPSIQSVATRVQKSLESTLASIHLSEIVAEIKNK